MKVVVYDNNGGRLTLLEGQALVVGVQNDLEVNVYSYGTPDALSHITMGLMDHTMSGLKDDN